MSITRPPSVFSAYFIVVSPCFTYPEPRFRPGLAAVRARPRLPLRGGERPLDLTIPGSPS
jgi:hypothetical protein